jgi:hypothetical protein
MTVWDHNTRIAAGLSDGEPQRSGIPTAQVLRVGAQVPNRSSPKIGKPYDRIFVSRNIPQGIYSDTPTTRCIESCRGCGSGPDHLRGKPEVQCLFRTRSWDAGWTRRC